MHLSVRINQEDVALIERAKLQLAALLRGTGQRAAPTAADVIRFAFEHLRPLIDDLERQPVLMPRLQAFEKKMGLKPANTPAHKRKSRPKRKT